MQRHIFKSRPYLLPLRVYRKCVQSSHKALFCDRRGLLFYIRCVKVSAEDYAHYCSLAVGLHSTSSVTK